MRNSAITIGLLNGVHLNNPEMLASLAEKLTSIEKYNWRRFKLLNNGQGVPTSLQNFFSWFEEAVNCIAATCNPFQRNPHIQKEEKVMAVKKTPARDPEECGFCKSENHNVKKRL